LKIRTVIREQPHPADWLNPDTTATEPGSAAVHTLGLSFAAGQLRTRLPGVMMQLHSAAPALLLCSLAALFKMSLSVDHVPMLLWSTQR